MLKWSPYIDVITNQQEERVVTVLNKDSLAETLFVENGWCYKETRLYCVSENWNINPSLVWQGGIQEINGNASWATICKIAGGMFILKLKLNLTV